MCDLRLGSLFPSLSTRPSVYLFTCLFCMHLPVPAPSVGETALFPGHYPGAYIPGLFPFCCADQAPILSPVHPANYCGFGYSSFQMLNSLASWDKLRLVLVSYYFYLLQNSICQYLVENFCIRVHERYLSVLSGSCFFFWFRCWSNCSLTKCLGKCSLSALWKRWRRIDIFLL